MNSATFTTAMLATSVLAQTSSLTTPAATTTTTSSRSYYVYTTRATPTPPAGAYIIPVPGYVTPYAGHEGASIVTAGADSTVAIVTCTPSSRSTTSGASTYAYIYTAPWYPGGCNTAVPTTYSFNAAGYFGYVAASTNNSGNLVAAATVGCTYGSGQTPGPSASATCTYVTSRGPSGYAGGSEQTTIYTRRLTAGLMTITAGTEKLAAAAAAATATTTATTTASTTATDSATGADGAFVQGNATLSTTTSAAASSTTGVLPARPSGAGARVGVMGASVGAMAGVAAVVALL